MKVPCDKCGGSGHTILPDILKETYDSRGRRPFDSTGNSRALPKTMMDSGVTAINRRLEQLLLMIGLVTRQRSGKAFLYTITPTKKETSDGRRKGHQQT